MGAVRVPLTAHCVVLSLLQMVAVSSEQFIVNGLQSPVLVPLGGNLELSCQLSPPQQAKHMEIRWFRNRYTEPIYLYRNGKDLLGETISKYVERTELVKDDIGRGRVTLRIFKVTADDDGSYHCFFKDDKFYEEHIILVNVVATSSDIQILMHAPNTKGVMLECHSRGWFPEPHMEWRDSNGVLIPATSKSHSQDENKIFTMKTSLLIEAKSHWNVTCYIQNPVTHQEESISVVLPGELFSWKIIWIMILSILSILLITFQMTYSIKEHLIHGIFQKVLSPTLNKNQCDPDKSEGSLEFLEEIALLIHQDCGVAQNCGNPETLLFHQIFATIECSCSPENSDTIKFLLQVINVTPQVSRINPDAIELLLEIIELTVRVSSMNPGLQNIQWINRNYPCCWNCKKHQKTRIKNGTKELQREIIELIHQSPHVNLGKINEDL
eukprot:XP_008762188.2 PREDICTED: selection and upkeep of intraepithelial T-cells protein 2-like isoform X1 [Rattus norvegicus]